MDDIGNGMEGFKIFGSFVRIAILTVRVGGGGGCKYHMKNLLCLSLLITSGE